MRVKNKIIQLFNIIFRKENEIDFIAEEGILLTDEDGEKMTFKGELIQNKPNGIGESKFDSGDTYIGYFNETKRDGIGMYKWNQGDYFVGNWKDNQRNGFGINYSKKTDTVIFGDFKNNVITNEKGTFSKSLNTNHCLMCGRNKKLVELMITGGLKHRTICNNCITQASRMLKKEMNYNDQDFLNLINKN